MESKSGMQYLLIDAANQFGLDKRSWDDREQWARSNEAHFFGMIEEAADSMLFLKAICTLRDARDNLPTGHMMGLDSTASGLQIMACLIGCHTSAANVNLINTGKREDIYEKVALTMSDIVGETVDRAVVKQPLMTTFYGSKAQPRSVFGDSTPELAAFYATLAEELPGAMEVLEDIQSCWNPEALAHCWTLPDGTVASVKVMEPISKKIEIDEMDHATFTHRVYVNQAQVSGISLCANIVHSIDAYVVREMIRRAKHQQFNLLTIHDNFLASPNCMDAVRQNYINIMAEIAESDILQDILRQVTGNSALVYKKRSTTLAAEIKKSEYALS